MHVWFTTIILSWQFINYYESYNYTKLQDYCMIHLLWHICTLSAQCVIIYGYIIMAANTLILSTSMRCAASIQNHSLPPSATGKRVDGIITTLDSRKIRHWNRHTSTDSSCVLAIENLWNRTRCSSLPSNDSPGMICTNIPNVCTANVFESLFSTTIEIADTIIRHSSDYNTAIWDACNKRI